MFRPTKSLAARIARDSKECCQNGHGMALFADGSTIFAISSNDVVARGASGGRWDYRIKYISRPMSRAEAMEMLLLATR